MGLYVCMLHMGESVHACCTDTSVFPRPGQAGERKSTFLTGLRCVYRNSAQDSLCQKWILSFVCWTHADAVWLICLFFFKHPYQLISKWTDQVSQGVALSQEGFLLPHSVISLTGCVPVCRYMSARLCVLETKVCVCVSEHVIANSVATSSWTPVKF